MSADEVGEDLGNTIFWPASNDQLRTSSNGLPEPSF